MLSMPLPVQANPSPDQSVSTTELPTLTVQTPDSSSPLYANNTLELNFTVTKPQSWDSYYQGIIPTVGEAVIYLFLDGVMNRAYPWTQNNVDQYTAAFTNLTQQPHTLWIDIYCYIYSDGSNDSVSQTVTFTINAQTQTISFSESPVETNSPGKFLTVIPLQTIPPKITILSPVTQTYNESYVSLVFTVDKAFNWLGYSLDGKQKITLTGNGTIANVTNGLHSVTVYANDTYGEISASTTTFTIDILHPEPFTVAPVFAVSVAVAMVIVVGVGLLVYIRHRKTASI